MTGQMTLDPDVVAQARILVVDDPGKRDAA